MYRFTRISTLALINAPPSPPPPPPLLPMRRLSEGGNYLSNYCNWQLKTLLHLGQNVITSRTLLHLGSFITFRPSTPRACYAG